MSHFWSYLVILVLILIAVRSMPLEAQPNKTCQPMGSSGKAGASTVEAWTKPGHSRPHGMSKRDTVTNDGRTSSISSTGSSTGSSSADPAVIRAVPEAMSSDVSPGIDTEPDCLLHHEYAQILGSNVHGAANDSRVKSFVNRHNVTRYYICLQCSICPPGVVILLHCHRKRDTVCGYTCVDPDHVYDPVQRICVPQLTPTNDSDVPPTTPPVVIQTTAFGGYFVEEPGDGVGLDVDDQALPMTTTVRPIQSSLSSQVTIITAGVLSLNALVILIAVVVVRKTKCRRRRKNGPWAGFVNNTLSSASTSNPSRLLVPSDFRQNESSQVNQDRNDSPVDQSLDIQVCVVPQSPGEEDGESTGQCPHRAKDCNLNVFHEPCLDEERVPATEGGSPSTVRPHVQVLRGKDPFWIVMLGQFGPEGGVLSCEDSDVVLEIPPGAIPADRKNQLIIARVSLRPNSVGPKMRDSDSMWLTPLVEFESPGLERFHKNVRMRLPHSACLQPGWDFKVHYTDPTAATHRKSNRAHSECQPSPLLPESPNSSDKWFDVEQKFPPRTSSLGRTPRTPSFEASDVTFTVDEKYFNVSTNHFSKYCCSGCHKARPLHMEVVVYWNHIKVEGHEQMDLNVYVVDRIKDSHMMIERNEKYSQQNNGYSALMLRCKKKHKEAAPLEISLKEEGMGDDWKWRLDTCNGLFTAKREIKISDLLRCCSPLMPFCESFSFRPKAGQGHPNLFQAVFGIKQLNWLDEDCKLIRVTVPLKNKDSSESISEVNDNYTFSGHVVTDKQIELVTDQLSYKKLRPLYRQLIGEGADNGMDHIVVRHPNDAREQIHEALVTWRRSVGHQATPEALEEALEAVRETLVAEELREQYKGSLVITESSIHETCQETAV